MKESLREGVTHSKSRIVPARELVRSLDPKNTLFSTMANVFATPYLVSFIEATCAELLHMHLEPHESSVGVHVNVSHEAATPVGMQVQAEVKVSAIDGRRIGFAVTVRDEVDIISRGTHERFVIDPERFLEKVREKGE